MEVVIKTNKLVDSLGTRYQLNISKIFASSTDNQLIGTYTDEDKIKEAAYNAYIGCVEHYGITNVFARSNY